MVTRLSAQERCRSGLACVDFSLYKTALLWENDVGRSNKKSIHSLHHVFFLVIVRFPGLGGMKSPA
jgi:hypothetical protein